MKTLAAGFAVCLLSAGAVSAGAISDPIVEPAVILADAADSSAPSAGLVLGLTTLIIFATAAAN